MALLTKVTTIIILPSPVPAHRRRARFRRWGKDVAVFFSSRRPSRAGKFRQNEGQISFSLIILWLCNQKVLILSTKNKGNSMKNEAYPLGSVLAESEAGDRRGSIASAFPLCGMSVVGRTSVSACMCFSPVLRIVPAAYPSLPSLPAQRTPQAFIKQQAYA